MFFKLIKKIFLICVLLTGCSERYCHDLSSVEEFVADSYAINEGKHGILEMSGFDSEILDPKLLEEKADLIEEEDIINIEIFHPARRDLVNLITNISHSNGFRVIDGKIFLPNLDYIEIANLTLKEVKEKIKNRYSKEISDIEVFVSFLKKKEKKVEVAGLVSSEIEINGKTRLFDVLAKVKIPINANLFKSYFLREGSFLPVDFYKLLKKGDMSQNVVMNDKDKIYIAESKSSKVYVLGEVPMQKAIDIPDGRISLKEAIAEAGGILPTADKSVIQIFRANVQNPKIYLLNWEYITRLPSSSLNLIEGDIVYIASKPLVDWNRFVSQILPTVSLIDSAYRGFKNMGIIIDGK
jgi:polysaccharide biosynthesis/export protein